MELSGTGNLQILETSGNRSIAIDPDDNNRQPVTGNVIAVNNTPQTPPVNPEKVDAQ